MTIVLTINIVLAAMILVAVVGPLIWAIRTEARDGVATRSTLGPEFAETSRSTTHHRLRRTATPTLSGPREITPELARPA
jgi:hypothetical protein